MLPPNKITIWENRSRQRLLKSYRDALTTYFGGSKDPQLRTQINQLNIPVQQVIRATGLNPAVVHRDAITHGGRHTVLDALSNVFQLSEFHISSQMIIDLVDMAIGAYAYSERSAKFRSYNPLFYITRFFTWIVDLPFEAAARVGADKERLESSNAGRIVKAGSAAVLWLLAVLKAIDELGLLQSLKELLGVKSP
jgi:hypothetical protein